MIPNLSNKIAIGAIVSGAGIAGYGLYKKDTMILAIGGFTILIGALTRYALRNTNRETFVKAMASNNDTKKPLVIGNELKTIENPPIVESTPSANDDAAIEELRNASLDEEDNDSLLEGELN